MIEIAILDDDEQALEKELRITKKFFEAKNLRCEVTTYGKVTWFMYDLMESGCDIYLLKVKLEEKNGIEIARNIRNLYLKSVIIFICDDPEYAIEAYEVEAYRFFSKEELEDKLWSCYETLLPKLLGEENCSYVIEKRGKVEKIPYDEILYYKKNGKYVVFVHKHGESRVRKSLETVQNELLSQNFHLVEKGYVVNIKYIQRMRGNELYMADNSVIYIGKKYVPELRRTLIEEWSK